MKDCKENVSYLTNHLTVEIIKTIKGATNSFKEEKLTEEKLIFDFPIGSPVVVKGERTIGTPDNLKGCKTEKVYDCSVLNPDGELQSPLMDVTVSESNLSEVKPSLLYELKVEKTGIDEKFPKGIISCNKLEPVERDIACNYEMGELIELIGWVPQTREYKFRIVRNTDVIYLKEGEFKPFVFRENIYNEFWRMTKVKPGESVGWVPYILINEFGGINQTLTIIEVDDGINVVCETESGHFIIVDVSKLQLEKWQAIELNKAEDCSNRFLSEIFNLPSIHDIRNLDKILNLSVREDISKLLYNGVIKIDAVYNTPVYRDVSIKESYTIEYLDNLDEVTIGQFIKLSIKKEKVMELLPRIIQKPTSDDFYSELNHYPYVPGDEIIDFLYNNTIAEATAYGQFKCFLLNLFEEFDNREKIVKEILYGYKHFSHLLSTRSTTILTEYFLTVCNLADDSILKTAKELLKERL